jgi:hypothetical protein
MTDLNPSYNSIFIGIVLSALDNIGIKPNLVSRQAIRVLAPSLNELAEQLYGRETSKDLKDFTKNWESLMKTTGFADPEKSEISVADNVVSMKVTNCVYLAMAAFGKSHGQAACPVCIINLVLGSLINNRGVGTVVDCDQKNSENICTIKMVIENISSLKNRD